MLAAIIGGRLQGVELACLAHHAGWRTLLVDRKNQVPARRLCDRFLQLDVRQASSLDDALKAVDLVIPALEDQAALDGLVGWCRDRRVPLAFDPKAYAVSSSKIDSDRLFASLGIPVPEPWPRCGFPVVAKPSCASGSQGVVILNGPSEAAAFAQGFSGHGWVLQQYLQGPSYSLEVIGRPGNYVPLQVTRLFMDAACDCKAVAAPCGLTAIQIREIEMLSVEIAQAIRLTGLMDVEVILHEGRFKVLEIDARFPSQTPLCVHASTGCNMFEMLADLFLSGKPPSPTGASVSSRSAIFEHIHVTPRAIFVEGEHIMADAGPLERVPGLFGADEAITNFREGAPDWVATLIVTAATRQRAVEKGNRVLDTIRRHFNLETIVDRGPQITA